MKNSINKEQVVIAFNEPFRFIHSKGSTVGIAMCKHCGSTDVERKASDGFYSCNKCKKNFVAFS